MILESSLYMSNKTDQSFYKVIFILFFKDADLGNEAKETVKVLNSYSSLSPSAS